MARISAQAQIKTSADTEILSLAREVLLLESAEINALADRLDSHFTKAVSLVLHCKGRVVLSGMGKSGHIANKIASTLASTGSPAFFMHPAEASHGDLGMITKDDVIIMLSNSGESEELLAILPLLKRLGTTTIAMTGNLDSTLAKHADSHLSTAVSKEACPLGLAPTASTTVSLALGDALALCVLDQRGFTAEDFAMSHPGGTLGRRLLTRVSDIMRTGDDIPKVGINTSLTDGLFEMTQKGIGLTAITDDNNKILGIFTDGDLRRAFEQGVNASNACIGEVMQTSPFTVQANQLAVKAVEIMEHHKIGALLVTDNTGKTLIGAINMHDLLRAKVV